MNSNLKITRWGAFAILIVLLLASTAVFAQGDRGSEKLQKQISIMEKIIDEAMVESANALVKSTHPTRGVYLEGYGPVFALEVGLVDERFKWDKLSKLLEFGDGYSVVKEEKEEGGETIITIKKKKGGEDVVVDEEVVSAEKRWTLVKEELVEVIRDYGDTIARAKPDEWFTIFATPLSGSWDSEKTDRLVVRVQMKDITDYNSGKMDDRSFAGKVQVQEN